MRRIVHHTREWAGRREKLVLVAIATVILGTLAFFGFSHDVMQGRTQGFDEWAVESLRDRDDRGMARGPDWLVGAVRDITALGSVAVVALFSLAALGFAVLRGNARLAVLILLAAGGGFLLNTLLKEVFDRPRPALPHIARMTSRSFPSGHAMVSATVYLSLAAVLATREKRRALKAYIVGAGAILTVLVGLSRVYLGFHYPTDVLAGWLGGLVWAVLCALITRAALGPRRTNDIQA
jgi:undecaprenyl-diphosphatase